MYRPQNFLLTILIVFSSGSAATSQVQKYDPDITCYGETLDVRMVGKNRNGDVVSEVFLNLPYKAHWWGVKLGHDNSLHYVGLSLTCARGSLIHDESLRVWFSYSSSSVWASASCAEPSNCSSARRASAGVWFSSDECSLT